DPRPGCADRATGAVAGVQLRAAAMAARRDLDPGHPGGDPGAAAADQGRAGGPAVPPSLDVRRRRHHLRSILRFKPAFCPTDFTLPAVLLMLGLCIWQVQRMGAKEDLIGRLHASMVQPPLDAAGVADDVVAAEYRKVRLTGTFLHDKEIH